MQAEEKNDCHITRGGKEANAQGQLEMPTARLPKPPNVSA